MNSTAQPAQRHRFVTGLLTFLALGLSPALAPAAGSEPPLALRVYHVGDRAPADIITPYAIAVPDPAETERQRELEARRAAPVVRYQSTAGHAALTELASTWNDTRGRFLALLHKSHGSRPLTASETGSTSFRLEVETFRAENPGTLCTLSLAQRWALGLPDQEWLADCSRRIEQAMEQRVLPDNPGLPEMPPDGAVRLVPATIPAGATNFAIWTQSRSNLVSLNEARQQLRVELVGHPAEAGLFLPGFLRANCFPDESLTQRVREQAIRSVVGMARFAPGDLIVARGAVIDEPTRAALDQLRQKIDGSGGRPVPSATEGGVSRWTNLMRSSIFWIAAGGLVLLVASWVLWRSFARPRANVLRTFDAPTPLNAVQWSARPTPEPSLARFLATEIVQRLFGQRQKLLETQMSVTAGAVEMEERLGRVKRQMHSRFQAYERRIAALERELAEAEELSRELIRAKIRTAKKELQEAKEQEMATERNRLNLN